MNNLNLDLFKVCDCGTNVNSEYSKSNYEFGAVGWFFWTMGTTATPKRISFQCTRCDKVYFGTEDKEVIKHFTLYRKK